MINVSGDRYTNYPDSIIPHCIYLLNYHSISINTSNDYVPIIEKDKKRTILKLVIWLYTLRN